MKMKKREPLTKEYRDSLAAKINNSKARNAREQDSGEDAAAQRKTKIAPHAPMIACLFSSCTRRKVKHGIIDTLNKKELDAISEIFRNILWNRVELYPSEKKRLKKARRHIEVLASNHKKSIATRRKHIKKQAGGFLLPLILSTVAPLVTRLIAKKIIK